MLSGSLVDGRFRVLRAFAPGALGIAFSQDLTTVHSCWLVQLALNCSPQQLSAALERHCRFGLGVPGLARPLAWGIEGERGYLVFAAPGSGSVADVPLASWTLPRAAALATRIAAALAPLHDQGIAYGLLIP